jgi:hypothetical protein
MNWKEHFGKAVDAVTTFAESDTAKTLTEKTKATAQLLAEKAKNGAMDAAESFVEANSDTAAIKVSYLNASVSVVSPSDALEVVRPKAGMLVVTDEHGNGVVIDAASDHPYVVETNGKVTRLDAGTFDLGEADGINLVILKT